MDTVTITNLTKKYGDLIAVDNLNLTIQKGEIFGLLAQAKQPHETVILCRILVVNSNKCCHQFAQAFVIQK